MTELLRRRLIGRDFIVLWLAQAGSSFGEYFFSATAVVWVATEIFSDSAHLPTYISLLVLSAAVPRIVVGPLAGVLVDRWNVRRTMIISDVIRAALFSILLTVVSVDLISDSGKYYATVLILMSSSVVAQFFNPARAAIMQVIIPPDRRVEASSTSMFALTGVAMVATATGPLAFAKLGPELSVTLCIVAYLLSLTMTFLVDTPDALTKGQVPENRFWSELVEGLRLAWSSPPVRVVLVGVFLYGISLGINNTTLGLFGLKSLGLTAEQYGLLSMMFPAGNLVSALVGVRILKRGGVQYCYVLSLIGLGSGYAVLGLCQVPAIAFPVMFFCGLAFSVYVMCQGPILQEATPIGYMGRMSAIASPLTAIASAGATFLASQVLGLAISQGDASEVGSTSVYGYAVAVGAVFMLAGGAIMLVGQRNSKASPSVPRSGAP